MQRAREWGEVLLTFAFALVAVVGSVALFLVGLALVFAIYGAALGGLAAGAVLAFEWLLEIVR